MPRCGDILEFSLGPTRGKEIRGSRPSLVLPMPSTRHPACCSSRRSPGDTASRKNGFSVNLLGTGSATQGVVLCDQTRTVDARARTFRKLEQVPAAVIEEALDAVRSILE